MFSLLTPPAKRVMRTFHAVLLEPQEWVPGSQAQETEPSQAPGS